MSAATEPDVAAKAAHLSLRHLLIEWERIAKETGTPCALARVAALRAKMEQPV